MEINILLLYIVIGLLSVLILGVLAIFLFFYRKAKMVIVDRDDQLIKKTEEINLLKERVIEATTSSINFQTQMQKMKAEFMEKERQYEERKAKFEVEVIKLISSEQAARDYAQWVGNTALETNKAYQQLLLENDRLKSRINQLLPPQQDSNQSATDQSVVDSTAVE